MAPIIKSGKWNLSDNSRKVLMLFLKFVYLVFHSVRTISIVRAGGEMESFVFGTIRVLFIMTTSILPLTLGFNSEIKFYVCVLEVYFTVWLLFLSGVPALLKRINSWISSNIYNMNFQGTQETLTGEVLYFILGQISILVVVGILYGIYLHHKTFRKVTRVMRKKIVSSKNRKFRVKRISRQEYRYYGGRGKKNEAKNLRFYGIKERSKLEEINDELSSYNSESVRKQTSNETKTCEGKDDDAIECVKEAENVTKTELEIEGYDDIVILPDLYEIDMISNDYLHNYKGDKELELDLKQEAETVVEGRSKPEYMHEAFEEVIVRGDSVEVETLEELF